MLVSPRGQRANISKIPYNSLSFLKSFLLKLDDIPIFLFMKCVGNRPPAMVPAKGVYMIKDIQRMQEYYGIPIIPPSVSVDIKILSFR